MSWRPSPAFGGLIASALFVQVTSGCLSNEYVIPRSELQRLASLPPETRGEHVRAVQEVGDRRSDALEPAPAPPAPPPPGPDAYYAEGDADARVDLRVDGDCCGGGGGRASGGSTARAGSGPGGWRGTSAPSSSGGGGWHGTPASSGGFHGTPAASGGGHGGGGGGAHGGGGGGFNFGGGGGGNDAAAVLVVAAVVLVCLAVGATVALAAGEGTRFDGAIAVAPGQPIYVKDFGGHVTEVSLAELSPALAAAAVEAKVMDDEGYGLRRLDRAPLDRRGGAFRLELGTSMFTYGQSQVTGPAAHIQLGVFPARSVGLLADIGLSGGSDSTDPAAGTIVRHSLALELDVLPFTLGRLHAGAFGKGGEAIAAGSGGYEAGPIAGGGGLVEVELTSRMALTMRAGANTAWLPSGISSAATFTGGISIY
jgi:hypothetical protein